ncbi:MAG: glycosyltransferase [Thermotogota bacterium]|nr:glycosyltransferase [Thermotogota bacterium]
MMELNKKIYVIFNTRVSLNGMSGGDRISLEFIKCWKDICDLYVIGTKLHYNFLIKNKIKINKKQFIEIPEIELFQSFNSLKILFIYLQRIFFFLVNFKKNIFSDGDFLYSSSDLIADTIIAFIIKIKNPKIKWVSGLYLVARNPFKGFGNQNSKKFKVPSANLLGFWFLQKISFFLISRYADEIWVLNKLDKDVLEKKTCTKIHVICGGIAFGYITSIPEPLIRKYDASYLGRFHPQKGIFDLINIWKLVCEKKPKAKLCIIGDGPEPFVKKVKMLIKENNLTNNIKLVGSKCDDEKFLLLKSSKIFLCPSHYESFAIVIAEAMACRLPVIAYDLPIYEDIYEKNILKVPIGDINQFAELVIKLLNESERGNTLSFKGQMFIQKYDWSVVGERELKHLKDLYE